MLTAYSSSCSESDADNDVSDFPDTERAATLIVVLETVVGVMHGDHSCGDQ